MIDTNNKIKSIAKQILIRDKEDDEYSIDDICNLARELSKTILEAQK